jgi:1-aminocyclopropane-1-carboxylate deaminase/D-cysteine desulfhydrase-like pyridoxal-dependent ACC family enzyme
VLVKRDDLACFGEERRSGVKARKLETFLAYLQASGVELLTMPLGNITNLGTDLVSVAAKAGIKLRLLIADDPPLSRQERVSLFKGLERETRLMNQRSFGITVHLLATFIRARLAGRKAFVIPPSPLHPTAVAGMALGYLEMARQIAESDGIFPRAIYIAAAAGSSVAGLALGEALLRLQGAAPVKIVAVQVTPYPLKAILPPLLWWTRRFLKLPRALDFSTLSVVVDPRNTVYGRFDTDHTELCKRLETQYGFLVDPIYGAKAWSVMEAREANSDRSLPPPLFWHCGYTPHWQQYLNAVGF